MTEPRPLTDILRDVVAHETEQPTHGSDCVCMDKLVLEARALITDVLPTLPQPMDMSSTAWDTAFGQRQRVRVVLNRAIRDL